MPESLAGPHSVPGMARMTSRRGAEAEQANVNSSSASPDGRLTGVGTEITGHHT